MHFETQKYAKELREKGLYELNISLLLKVIFNVNHQAYNVNNPFFVITVCAY